MDDDAQVVEPKELRQVFRVFLGQRRKLWQQLIQDFDFKQAKYWLIICSWDLPRAHVCVLCLSCHVRKETLLLPGTLERGYRGGAFGPNEKINFSIRSESKLALGVHFAEGKHFQQPHFAAKSSWWSPEVLITLSSAMSAVGGPFCKAEEVPMSSGEV